MSLGSFFGTDDPYAKQREMLNQASTTAMGIAREGIYGAGGPEKIMAKFQAGLMAKEELNRKNMATYLSRKYGNTPGVADSLMVSSRMNAFAQAQTMGADMARENARSRLDALTPMAQIGESMSKLVPAASGMDKLIGAVKGGIGLYTGGMSILNSFKKKKSPYDLGEVSTPRPRYSDYPDDPNDEGY